MFKKYSIRSLLLGIFVIALVLATCQFNIEVEFVGNHPSDMREGCHVTLREGNRYLSQKQIESVFVGYSDFNQSFVVKMRFVDWLQLKRSQEYSMEAEELLFWPTVQLAPE